MPGAGTETPDLSIPVGGGTLRGLAAEVEALEFRGSARLTIPINLPSARGAGPRLAVTYDSGSGNGPLGAGASIDLPSIGRTTAVGVPTYTDADLITFSETGLLVERGSWSGDRWNPVERTVTDSDGETWLVREYLPRLQGAFPLIERWTRLDDRLSHWRVVSADNVESRFGVRPDARIAHPDDPTQILEWLIEEVTDPQGNVTRYHYKAEDSEGAASRPGAFTNRYVERIEYGNYPGGEEPCFAFQVVFDYGEYDLDGLSAPNSNPYIPAQPWPLRPDPFSSYRPGFDLRTNRLLRGVLTFNCFPDVLGAEPCLTAAVRFEYADSPYLSTLRAVTQWGYRRQPDGSYTVEALPPVTLDFADFSPPPAPEFRRLEVERQADLPGYLVPGAYQPVDLDGEGIPGFLESNEAVTYYYSPLGGGRYAAARSLETFPDYSNLANPRLALTDLDGDGRLELLVTAETETGFFRRLDRGGWGGFEPVRYQPTLEESPSVEYVDLNGNGLTDLLTLRRTAVQYYASRGETGFAPMRSAERQPGFPSAAANSASEFVLFADVFGDGLAHRVRVTAGEVAVWPNLGHGRFGAKLVLPGAPSFGGGMQPSRSYFADLDGTGVADLVVAASDRLVIYRNESGNGFSAPFTVPLPFRLGDNDQLSFADILGNGTMAVVATRTSPAVEHWFTDLSFPGGEPGSRPYLLLRVHNGQGATTEISYRSSASFYLDDKREGRTWPTRLPFPIQLVERLTVTDGVTGAQTVQKYRYHDGYYDGRARTFRGFGYVEYWQEQCYAPFAPAPDWPVERVNADLRVTPGYSRSWFTTGAYFESAALERQYAREYYAGDPHEARLPPNVFDPALLAAGGATLRQAYAALAGRPIRTEQYADEGAAQASAAPFSITAANYLVQLVQPPDPQGVASVLVRDREGLNSVYEREAAGPRVEHSFFLLSTLLDPGPSDSFYERRCTVCYPRRSGAPDACPEQFVLKAVAEEGWATRVSAPFRRIGTSYEQRTLDLGGLTPPEGGIYPFSEIEQQVALALEDVIPYGQPFAGDTPQARTSQHLQRLFWNEAQTEPLPLGQISARALLHHEQHAVFSQLWREEQFGARLSDDDLTDLAGLVEDENEYWWNPGLIQTYFPPEQPQLFFLPSGTVSPSQAPGLFQQSTVGYDTPYALFPVEIVHAVNADTSLVTTARYDYQALQPSQVTDANGVVRQALYTPLGLVLADSVFKPASNITSRIGDGDLADYVVVPGATFASVLDEPGTYLQEASSYYFYDLEAWIRASPQPLASITLRRTRFVSDGIADASIEIQIDYSDGLGRPLERKLACEPAVEGGPERWLVSDRTVLNGQGRAAQLYLPFYSPAPEYEPQQLLADANLVPPPRIEVRDPLDRVIRVATPQGFFTRTEYRAWRTVQYDEDDTLLDAPYYIDFMAHYPADPTQAERDEKAALEKTVPFYNTPTTEILDNAGHAVRRIVSNLGNVPPDAFVEIVSGTVTSEELWSALIAAGYLETREVPQGTWITAKFQPYTPGFKISLPPPYDQFSEPAAAILTQACLTTLLVVDITGRLLEAADPRLFLARIQGESHAYSAYYAYPMGEQTAAHADSGDAGPRWQLASFLGTAVLSFDAMGRRRQQLYDGLQRLLATQVTEAEQSTRTVEVLTYGEGQPDAAAANLMGQVYQIDDEAGTLLYPAYTILGQASQSVRQFAVDYQSPLDWANPVLLDPETYASGFTYDEQGRILTETLPDTSQVVREYWCSGRLRSITVTLPGESSRSFITGISYAADGNRTAVLFGNQLLQELEYEVSTGRLVALSATRPPSTPGDDPRDPLLQSVNYTYDPVGNVSVVRDRTAQLLFCGGTEPEAVGDYTYNPLYQLVSATGLQHPGITADTHVTGFMQSLYAELCPAGSPPITLEPYTEGYEYDLSGNLVGLRHTATSASFDRAFPVRADSNRLLDTPYDANGNAQTAQLLGSAPLAWDTRNLLARVGPFEMPEGGFDDDYQVYDFFRERVRRVVQHRTDLLTDPDLIEEERVIGGYLVKSTTHPATSQTVSVSILRIQDASACFVVTDSQSGDPPEIRYQLSDRLGSITTEVGQDGGILSYEAYYPFGGTAIVAGYDQAVVARKLLRYSGKPVDEDTGFYYYGARYYLPWQGRWLSADPSGAADGLNQFQFVGGNPVTLVDTDGRGKNKPTQSANRELLNNFMKWVLYGVYTAPLHAFYYAPINIKRRLTGSEQERAEARQNARARLEESRLLYYNLALAYGIDPEKHLPSQVIPYIKPQSKPWSMVWIPGYGYPLHRELRDRTSTPEFWTSQVGPGLGSFLTVGGSLAIVRNLYKPARLSPKAMAATFVLSTLLATIGQGEESDRVYSRHQAEQSKLWFWQRSRTPGLSGIPRRLVYTEYAEKRAQELWASTSPELIALIFTAALLYRFAGPAGAARTHRWARSWWQSKDFRNWRGGSRSGSGSGSLMVLPKKELMVPKKPISGPPAVIVKTPKDLALYEPPVTSLTVVQPKSTALAPVRPKSTALVPVKPKSTAVQPYRAPANALMLVPEQVTALQLYQPIRQFARTMKSRGNLTMVITGAVLTSGVAFYQYVKQKSTK